MQKFLRFRLPKEQLQLVVGDLGASNGIAALDFLKAQRRRDQEPSNSKMQFRGLGVCRVEGWLAF